MRFWRAAVDEALGKAIEAFTDVFVRRDGRGRPRRRISTKLQA